MHKLFPNSFLIDLRLSQDCPRLPIESDCRVVGILDLYTEISNPRYMQTFSDSECFAIYFGDQLHRCAHYPELKKEARWDPNRDNGCLISYDKPTAKIRIDSDLLGTEIAYYWRLTDRLVISNRLDNFRLISDPTVDVASLLEFLRGAYTVGERTLFHGVRKTRPLTCVEVDCRSGDVQSHRSGQWRGGEQEASFPEIAEQWQRTLESAPPCVLMLSAGWDSRLLLAANATRVCSTYTHGDLLSREIGISVDIGRRYSPQVTARTLEESSFGVGALCDRLRQLGHAFHGHWYSAAQYASAVHSVPISAGLFVEHFSGHYGVNSVGQGWSKLAATLKSMLLPRTYDDLSAGEAISMSFRLLHGRLKAPWYLYPDWLSEHANYEHETGDDIERTLVEFQEESTGGVQEIFERFRLEHPGRQYFALQTKCGIPFDGYHHPFADSRLGQMVLSIPYSKRVNYRLSQAVLRQLDPRLLNWPMAATTISAKWPVVSQEMSRGVRILFERVATARRNKRQLHLGWNNFEFLFATDVFDSYIDHLRGNIWPKDQMRAAIRLMDQKGTSAYSVLHMFTKILTADYLLYGQS